MDNSVARNRLLGFPQTISRGWLTKPLVSRVLIAIVAMAAIHGLVYVLVIPPWQHYDEPNHFEYAWLIANRPSLPRPGDFDQGLRNQVVASMIQHNFYYGMGPVPDISAGNVSVGAYTKVGDPPLYYWLVSLPLRVLGAADITVQLYAARLVSWLLFLITIVAAWGTMTELLPGNHPLRWMVPCTLALLPSFVDLMTAVNSDVGAVTFFSLFLWGSASLVRRGISRGTLFFAGFSTGLCLLSKSTGYLAVPLLAVAFLFGLFRGSRRLWAWGLLSVGLTVAAGLVFSWGDAAYWHTNSVQDKATSAYNAQAPLGVRALQITATPQAIAPDLMQPLPSETMREIAGKTVTLGAWMWATQPVRARTPALYIYEDNQTYFGEVDISTRPTFYAIQIPVVGRPSRAWLSLMPFAQVRDSVTVFYDGLVLVDGEYPYDQRPDFGEADGRDGLWGGRPFLNLVRNASAEQSWPRIRPWFDRIGERFIPDRGRPSQMLDSVLDAPALDWYYSIILPHIFETFWARFGWGHVPLLAPEGYSVLMALTAVGIVGAGVALIHHRRSIPWPMVAVLGLTVIGVWGLAISRGSMYLLLENVPAFVPTARYAYPAIIPTALLLNVGWWQLLWEPSRRLHISDRLRSAVYISLFLVFDIYAFASIVVFYSNRR